MKYDDFGAKVTQRKFHSRQQWHARTFKTRALLKQACEIRLKNYEAPGTIVVGGEFMIPSYRAILHGDHLEWPDGAPSAINRLQPVQILVTVVTPMEPDAGQQGAAMADALQRIADRGGIPIADPSDWQREQRQDRPLIGRAE